ncbi:hypothetical protein HMPREF2787_10550 [Corynebacterium sp. HMSC061H03]|uniref:hypothetical protein n=1 Tax=Corynebacterium sp. HMSC061H03 TaxID=1739291 RepID=UPI00090F75A4|nr:hypothetical protein [Corynebacterium sp. HMSC061H03]OHR23861.1 hypothetical protein HMPREF2787_10550 [Corynebacterium sp. HMSC061H03]
MTQRMLIAGNVSSALTHFATYGLALLIDSDIDGAESRVFFTEEAYPRAILEIDGCAPPDVATALRAIAQRWADRKSWAQATMEYPDGKQTVARSPFSPRIKQFGDSLVWERHSSFRNNYLDSLSTDSMALQFIQGLGEAAYWRQESNSPRPDEGASRWEMKTRNHGQEFIVHRLAPLVTELAAWPVEQILGGLEGKILNDVIGKNKADSRSASGFTAPRPTDNALAFAALLGMSMVPPIRNIDALSVTPGAYPQNITHPNWMVLPVPTTPVTSERLRSILLSKQLDEVAKSVLEMNGNRLSAPEAGKIWLRNRGVPAVAVFSILKAGSASAPERQVLNGNLVVL